LSCVSAQRFLVLTFCQGISSVISSTTSTSKTHLNGMGLTTRYGTKITRRERITTFLVGRKMIASDVRSRAPPRMRCMIFMCFFSSDRRSAPAHEMDRDDERLQLIPFCFICGWSRFLVWLTKDQGAYGRGPISITTSFNLRSGFLNVSRSYISRISPLRFRASRFLCPTGRTAKRSSGP
jgi:hypothetical protein